MLIYQKVIHTENAPAAIGTYSQARSTENLTFISGQIPLDPATMEIVKGDFKSRARRVFMNIQAIAEEAGGSLNDICKLTIFLTNLNDFSAVNEVMEEYFDSPYPARAALEVSALPKGGRVEIDCIAWLGKS